MISLDLFLKNRVGAYDRFVIYAFCFPFVINIMLCGQTGLFTASIMLLGFAVIKKKPYWAGVIFSLITFKPQLAIGLLIPLLATKNYKSLSTFFSYIFISNIKLILRLWK